MLKMKSFLILYLSSFRMLILKTAHSSNHSYKLRISKAGSCDNSNSTYILKEISIREYHEQHYLHAVVDLLKDMPVANITVTIENCDLTGANCNEFGQFHVKDVCKIVFMKNMFWSEAISTITPRPECPIIKKNEYTMNNATVNMNDIVKLYPNTTKYYWKMKSVFNDMEDKPIACAFAEGATKLYEL